MFFFLFAASLSILPPGYDAVSINDTNVVRVYPFLKQNLPLLFPDINFNRDSFNVTEAGIRIVSGYNLYITINISSTLIVSLKIWVNNRNHIQLYEVSSPMPSSTRLNAYMWYDPSHFTSAQQEHLTKLIKDNRNVNLKIRRIIAYRARQYASSQQHVIFDDSNGIIHAAVVTYSPSTQSSILEFYDAVQ